MIGARPAVLKNLENDFKVDSKYRAKWKRSKRVAQFLNVLGSADRMVFKFRKNSVEMPEKPIFVIGHWRSGTTLAHNFLCDITDASYCTTYQNAFPNNLFAFYRLMRLGMQKFMPKERPADGLKMHTMLPQEEEFAIGNEIYHCFYYWMFFPRNTKEITQKFLVTSDSHQRMRWWKNYFRFVRRTMLRNRGEVFISKNPPNTARIEDLLELFPKAKFIFLHRDPYATLRSTKRFYRGVLPAQQHQTISDQELEDQIFETHKILHHRYLETKNLIPEENLKEIPFADLVKDPIKELTLVLNRWNVPYNVTTPIRKKYSKDDHKVHDYNFSKEFVTRVNNELSSYLKHFGYDKR